MNAKSAATDIDQVPIGTAPIVEARSESILSTWVSSMACLACITIYICLATRNNTNSWATLKQFGYLPADSIWGGQYWALITSVFVHMALWHVAFNVYWLWALGSRLERAIGSFSFLTFFLTSAFVSSSYQLGTSGTTGIGASGVVYAIFGFMWLTRGRYQLFEEVLDQRTILIFVVWLFGCLAATIFDVWQVGNAAHFSGLLFGCCVATVFVMKRAFAIPILGGVFAISVVVLFWCPWSITWLQTKAYDSHKAGRYQDAIEQYTRIIHLAPQNVWALRNRSYAYQALGENVKAEIDLEMARKIDPNIEKSP